MLFGEFDLLARVKRTMNLPHTMHCRRIRPLEGIQDTKTMIGAEL